MSLNLSPFPPYVPLCVCVCVNPSIHNSKLYHCNLSKLHYNFSYFQSYSTFPCRRYLEFIAVRSGLKEKFPSNTFQIKRSGISPHSLEQNLCSNINVNVNIHGQERESTQSILSQVLHSQISMKFVHYRTRIREQRNLCGPSRNIFLQEKSSISKE